MDTTHATHDDNATHAEILMLATAPDRLPKPGTTFRYVFADEEIADRFMRRANRAFWRAQRLDSLACRIDGPDDAFTIADYATAVDIGLPFTWRV